MSISKNKYTGLNVIFTSYDEAEEIKQRIVKFENTPNIRIHILEAINIDAWDSVMQSELSQFDVRVYRVDAKPYAELHWVELQKFDISENCLFLCADEQIELTKINVERILSCDVATFPRRNFVGAKFFKGSGLGEHQDLNARFFKKPKLIENYSGKVHVFPFRIDNPTFFENILMEHFSYKDLFDLIARFNRYTDLEARHIKQSHNTPYVIYRGVKHFIRRYIFQKGYSDGLLGLIFCILMGLYFPISYYKCREAASNLK